MKNELALKVSLINDLKFSLKKKEASLNAHRSALIKERRALSIHRSMYNKLTNKISQLNKNIILDANKWVREEIKLRHAINEMCSIMSRNLLKCDKYFKSSFHEPSIGIGRATQVAHAMGRIEGHNYTNSLEAFLYNYKRGFRVFEVDLVLSAEGIPIARHAGAHMFKILEQEPPQRILKNQTEQFTSNEQGEPLTLDEFKRLKINKKYTPLDIYDLISLLQMYPDVVFLLDHGYNFFPLHKRTALHKIIVKIICNIDSDLMDRIIPYNMDEDFLAALKNIYPYKRIIYVIKSKPNRNYNHIFSVIEKEKSVFAIFLGPWLALNTNLVKRAKKLKKWVYVVMGTSKQQINQLRSVGVDGVYVDIFFNLDE